MKVRYEITVSGVIPPSYKDGDVVGICHIPRGATMVSAKLDQDMAKVVYEIDRDLTGGLFDPQPYDGDAVIFLDRAFKVIKNLAKPGDTIKIELEAE